MAALFIQNFRKLRSIVPILPDLMEATDRIVTKLTRLSDMCPGVVALDGGKLLGYMAWFVVDHFRGTERTCAFCPEWGHGAVEGLKPQIYRAMYRVAAGYWAESGCQVHGLTLLAHDAQAEKVWYWNGFGMAVVDAIRSIQPLEGVSPDDVCVRKATLDDVDTLAVMEIEHRQHYLEPPVLMQAYHPVNAEALAQFISEPQNSLWVALDGSDYMGYMRFEVNNTDSAAIVIAPDRISNTGAFVRPQYRGNKIAARILNAALRDYAVQGFKRCSVDFESFNPEAAAFWLRYFEPVCFSLLRVPERVI
jgi:GNAT superfamily N-acetyltransferase